MLISLFFFFPSRDQEWQLKEHPGSLLHLVALQAAAAAAAAVLPVPGGAQPAGQQRCAACQQPQITRDAVQVCCTEHRRHEKAEDADCEADECLFWFPVAALLVWDA